MPASAREKFLGNVERAVERRARKCDPPDLTPVRLVGPDDDVVGLFIERAEDAGMAVSRMSKSHLPAGIIEILRGHQAKSVVLTPESLFKTIGLASRIQDAGIQVISSIQSDDDLFAADAGITGAINAVAETGSIVLAASAGSPRQAGLVPPVHLAVLREDHVLPDLLDLMASLGGGNHGDLPSNLCLITGPSKSADIELTLVKGVHGPGVVHVVLLPAPMPRRGSKSGIRPAHLR